MGLITHLLAVALFVFLISKYYDKWIVDGTVDKVEDSIKELVGILGLLVIQGIVGVIIMVVFLYWLPNTINTFLGIN